MRNASIKTVGTFPSQSLCYIYTKVAHKTIISFICMRKNTEMELWKKGHFVFRSQNGTQRNEGLKPPHINQNNGWISWKYCDLKYCRTWMWSSLTRAVDRAAPSLELMRWEVGAPADAAPSAQHRAGDTGREGESGSAPKSRKAPALCTVNAASKS